MEGGCGGGVKVRRTTALIRYPKMNLMATASPEKNSVGP